MRRKSDFVSVLTEMFCDDDKKRINAIKSLRDIASAMGPPRVKTEFIPFLNEFLDDDPQVMLAVLAELANFSPFLGGVEHEKILLPLLINFCFLDEREVALQAVGLIKSILERHSDGYLDTIKKMAKMNMVVSKECTAILVAEAIEKVPHLEETLLEIYKTLIFSEVPAFRIIGAKHLSKLCTRANNKEEILKMVDLIYNDSEDLPKLLTIDTLLQLYPVNPTSVLSKLKTLICMGNWRTNLRLCEFATEYSTILSKNHYKVLFEPYFLKLMSSEDVEIKAAACGSMAGLAKNMTPEETVSKLLPIMVKLGEDKAPLVKTEFAKNLVKVFPFFGKDKVQESLIPMVIKLIKDSNLEVASSILVDFKEMSKHLNLSKFEEIVLKPLATQLSAENWRLKISTLGILGRIIVEQNLYTPFVVDLLLNEMKDKIQAIRRKAAEIIVDIIKASNREWCDSMLMPKLLRFKDQMSYLVRQKLLMVIQLTSDCVSASTQAEYRKILTAFLSDKIPNIRVSALRVVCGQRKLADKIIEVLILKLKDDADIEVKQLAKAIKI